MDDTSQQATPSPSSFSQPPSYLYHLHPHESSEEGAVLECPGYCGRVPLPFHSLNYTSHTPPPPSTAGWSACQACPYGQRSEASVCRDCIHPLTTYDYCFLLFYSLLPLFVNVLFHAQWRRRRRRKRSAGSSSTTDHISENLWLVLQVSSALVEASVSATGALLLAQPRGSMEVFGCAKSGGLQEWYSALANPVIDYARTLKCSHELIYPM